MSDRTPDHFTPHFTWTEVGAVHEELRELVEPSIREMAQALEVLRARAGDQPLTVTRWYAPGLTHGPACVHLPLGLEVDLQAGHIEPLALGRLALQLGFTSAVILADGTVHVTTTPHDTPQVPLLRWSSGVLEVVEPRDGATRVVSIMTILDPEILPPIPATPEVPTLPAGVTTKSGVVLNTKQIQFLVRLRAELPADVPLLVTSGTRSAEAQAAALVTKRKAADALRAAGKDPGDADLTKLYRQNIAVAQELLSVANTVEAMAAVLKRWMDKGVYLSRHMRGDALDLRSSGTVGTIKVTSTHVKKIKAAAEKLGAKVLIEKSPPHVHIEKIAGLV